MLNGCGVEWMDGDGGGGWMLGLEKFHFFFFGKPNQAYRLLFNNICSNNFFLIIFNKIHYQ